MKKLFLILVLICSFTSCAQETKKPQLISQEEFAKISTKEVQLLDLRTPQEQQQGFIEGAILINFFDSDFISKVTTRFDKNKPLYIYCAVGGRSNKAARKLISVGFDSIYDLKGGFTKWKNLK
ncbi:rhodanese-like domain-containing protein [Flavobacteriaceae bacterium]|nr:rhodanese-like domain-containing protein [Flavobacteriaceae bacterium]